MEEKRDYIELNTFLKIKGIAGTGGAAKQKIRNEEVKVNGEIETRNKRKLRAGDKIETAGQRFFLKEDEIM